MNIIKGLDRMSLVIAIIVGVLGLFGGSGIVYEHFKTETLEYKTWVKEHGTLSSHLVPFRASGDLTDLGYSNITKPPAPEQYNYPPLWVVLPSGAVSACLTFMIALFSLRGTTRLFVWIIKGFKDE